MKRRTWTTIIFIGICLGFTSIFAQSTQSAEADSGATAVHIQQIESYYYCCVEMTGSYDQHADAFEMLYSSGAEQSIPVQQGIPFGIYYDDPGSTSMDSLKWEIGVPLSEKMEVKDPLKVKEWNYNLMASRIYEGTFDEQLGAVYQDVFQWISANKYRPAGPLMEKYLSEPGQNEDGEWIGRIEILVPVEKVN